MTTKAETLIELKKYQKKKYNRTQKIFFEKKII